MSIPTKNTFVNIPALKPVLRRTMSDATLLSRKEQSVAATWSVPTSLSEKPVAMDLPESRASWSTADSETQGDGPLMLLLRNLPHPKNASQLLSHFNASGFRGSYDVFFMPMTAAGRNLGFAFMRFRSSEDADEFTAAFAGVTLGKKPLQTIVAEIQSIDELSGSGSTKPMFFDSVGSIVDELKEQN